VRSIARELAASAWIRSAYSQVKEFVCSLTWTDGCCVMWRFRTRCEVLRPAEPRSRRLCSKICSGSLFFTSTTRWLRLAAVPRVRKPPHQACLVATLQQAVVWLTSNFQQTIPQHAWTTGNSCQLDIAPYSAVRCGCWPRLTCAAMSSCGLCSLKEGRILCRKSLQGNHKGVCWRFSGKRATVSVMSAGGICMWRFHVGKRPLEPHVVQRTIRQPQDHTKQLLLGACCRCWHLAPRELPPQSQ
jgi:hypothetical protein